MLPEEDVKQYGSSVSQALVSAVPDGFLGITAAELEPTEVPVGTIDSIYRDLFGFATGHPPTTLAEWASVDESTLCYASSGFVIYDAAGALSERMSEFRESYYPTDIWKWKIAATLWGIWHCGEYNSCDRLAKRGDGVGLLVGQGAFVEGALRLMILLNRRFSVYWKWLHWQFQGLPKWVELVAPPLCKLEAAASHEARADAIRETCQMIRHALHEEQLLPDAEWRNFMGSVDILRQIECDDVRQLIRQKEPHLDVW